MALRELLKPWLKFETGRIPWMAWEWWIMRAGLGIVFFPAVDFPATWDSQPEPVGIAQFMDLTWLHGASWLSPLLMVALVFYILGVFPLLSTGILMATQVMVTTLGTSQGGGGGAHHTSHIIAITLLAQCLGILYHYIQSWRSGCLREAWRAQWQWLPHLSRTPAAASRTDSASTVERHAFSLRKYQIDVMLQATAAAYVVSGISKLIRSKGQWVSEVVHIPLQFEKNRLNRIADIADPAAGASADLAESAAEWVAAHPGIAAAFFSIGLFLELFAFLGLWNRRTLAVFGIGLFVMHTSISVLMSLGFYFNKWALVLLWVNIPFWIMACLRKLRSPANN